MKRRHQQSSLGHRHPRLFPFLPAVSHPPATTSKWVRRAARALRNAGARHGASYIGVATLGALSERLRGQIPATREADREGPVDKRAPKLGALLVNRAKTTPSVKRPPAQTWQVDSDNAILRQHHAACRTSHRLGGRVNPCSTTHVARGADSKRLASLPHLVTSQRRKLTHDSFLPVPETEDGGGVVVGRGGGVW